MQIWYKPDIRFGERVRRCIFINMWMHQRTVWKVVTSQNKSLETMMTTRRTATKFYINFILITSKHFLRGGTFTQDWQTQWPMLHRFLPHVKHRMLFLWVGGYWVHSSFWLKEWPIVSRAEQTCQGGWATSENDLQSLQLSTDVCLYNSYNVIIMCRHICASKCAFPRPLNFTCNADRAVFCCGSDHCDLKWEASNGRSSEEIELIYYNELVFDDDIEDEIYFPIIFNFNIENSLII